MFCSVKDKIPTHQKSNVTYKIKCPECGEDYVGKTGRYVIKRLNEHSNHSDQPMFQQLLDCEKFLETMILYQLPDIDTDISTAKLKAHIASAFSYNWKILDSNTNWVPLHFLESTYIQPLKPKLNDGLKASKELLLFR